MCEVQNSDWCLDGGCTSHLCKDKKSFLYMEKEKVMSSQPIKLQQKWWRKDVFKL